MDFLCFMNVGEYEAWFSLLFFCLSVSLSVSFSLSRRHIKKNSYFTSVSSGMTEIRERREEKTRKSLLTAVALYAFFSSIFSFLGEGYCFYKSKEIEKEEETLQCKASTQSIGSRIYFILISLPFLKHSSPSALCRSKRRLELRSHRGPWPQFRAA